MASPSQIHIIRHAESVHNVTKDFSQLDPPLTPLGVTQAAQLQHSFPHAARIGLIITSPLRRAIQTTLAGFAHVLDERYYEPGSGQGVANGVRLVLDPLLQERSGLACDTGREVRVLKEEFGGWVEEGEFGKGSGSGEGWPGKEGIFGTGDEVVRERAGRVRGNLKRVSEELEGKDVVVVTHGVFMKFLTGDEGIDLPKAGWRSYVAEGEEGEVRLVAV